MRRVSRCYEGPNKPPDDDNLVELKGNRQYSNKSGLRKQSIDNRIDFENDDKEIGSKVCGNDEDENEEKKAATPVRKIRKNSWYTLIRRELGKEDRVYWWILKEGFKGTPAQMERARELLLKHTPEYLIGENPPKDPHKLFTMVRNKLHETTAELYKELWDKRVKPGQSVGDFIKGLEELIVEINPHCETPDHILRAVLEAGLDQDSKKWIKKNHEHSNFKTIIEHLECCRGNVVPMKINADTDNKQFGQDVGVGKRKHESDNEAKKETEFKSKYEPSHGAIKLEPSQYVGMSQASGSMSRDPIKTYEMDSKVMEGQEQPKGIAFPRTYQAQIVWQKGNAAASSSSDI